jgi:hypothetical protein
LGIERVEFEVEIMLGRGAKPASIFAEYILEAYQGIFFNEQGIRTRTNILTTRLRWAGVSRKAASSGR